MEGPESGGGMYGRIGELAAHLGLKAGAEGIAALAAERGFGEAELSAIEAVLAQEAGERKAASVDTLIRLSRLPKRGPRTFEGFDFSRIQGRDVKALRALPELSDLVAARSIAFIGPEGIGKTHLAQAYGYECCRQGYRTYCLKATELRDRLVKAASSRSTLKCVSSLMKRPCLIIDEIGRCTFGRDCTDLFFGIVDRRYEKEGAELDGARLQHGCERMEGALHRGRRAAVRARQDIRQGIGLRHERAQLPRPQLRDALRRSSAHGSAREDASETRQQPPGAQERAARDHAGRDISHIHPTRLAVLLRLRVAVLFRLCGRPILPGSNNDKASVMHRYITPSFPIGRFVRWYIFIYIVYGQPQ